MQVRLLIVRTANSPAYGLEEHTVLVATQDRRCLSDEPQDALFY